MGKGSGEARTTIAEYRMSMHFGICHGPIDSLIGINVGDKPAWEGEVYSGVIVIDKPDLFGGRLKEGGLNGRVFVYAGDETQLMNAEIAAKWGGTPTTVPGFRGIANAFFLTREGQRAGFLWSTNTPYVKNTSFKVRRSPKGFYPEKAMIGPDANPAHIIYECLTNGSWGMGGSPSQIDATNFQEVADIFFAEGLGLSLMWSGQTTIESFVQEILDHVEATFFTNPRTGLINIKPIRPDFDLANMFHVTEDNAKITKFQRKGWGETVNEINAAWTNPVNEQEENVTVHDLGNIASQGEIVPSSRNYYGVRNSAMALRLAQRDLQAAAFPLASCEIVINRSAWKEVPGGVVKVSSARHGLNELVMRVGNINYGRPGKPELVITLMEDVFALPLNSYVEAPETEWQDPAAEPYPLAYSKFFNIPYYIAARALGDTQAEAVEYPQSYVTILGAQSTPGTVSIDVRAEGVDTVGNLAFRSVGEFSPAGRGTLSAAIPEATTSALPSFSTFFGNVGIESGSFMLLGGGGDGDTELVLIESISAGVATVRRGVLDTVPRAWPIGTVAWLFRPMSFTYDRTARAAGQTARYKLLPRTGLGLLDPGVAPIQTFLVGDRLHRPFRPANVRVNGTLFGPAGLDYADDGMVITWSNRNRLTETSLLLGWTDASVGVEAGQTVRVTIYNADGSILQQQAGITGTSFTATFLPSAITGSMIRYVVESERDGLWSLQSASKTITML